MISQQIQKIWKVFMEKIIKMNKKAKGNLSKWSWIVKFNIIKVSVLSKLTYTLDSIQLQVKLQKKISHKIWQIKPKL